MTDLTCDLGRKESKRWRNVNPIIIIILTVGIYRTHLNIYYQHQNYDILLLVPICQQHIMTSIALPICHRMKFYSQFVVVSIPFHLIQYVQLLINLLLATAKNQISKIAILIHIVLAVKTRIEL